MFFINITLKNEIIYDIMSSSTYTSRFIIPGRRAGNIKQIISNVEKCDIVTTNTTLEIPQPFIVTSGNPNVQYIIILHLQAIHPYYF